MALKASELRQQSKDELRSQEQELADKLLSLRLQKVTGELEKPAKITEVKRDLARVLTVLREKELAS
jgi:large subunit ribosomal protein L29